MSATIEITDTSTLKEVAEAIDSLRIVMLFEHEHRDGLSPQAEQFFLLALASLEQAQHHMMLAHYNDMRRD